MPVMRLTVEVDGETKLQMQRELRGIGVPNIRFCESPPLRDIARAFMGDDRPGTPVDSVTSLKKISRAGDSLSVAVTKEAKKLGVGKGDAVYVTLEKVIE